MKKACKTALVALVAGLAACSDGLVAPQDAPTTSSVDRGGSLETLTGSDTLKFNITIDPSRTTNADLGYGNSITFPSHSVCDPTKASYGVGEWDKPCTPAYSSITVPVKAWLDATGHPRTDFGKNLRFVPSSNSQNWVKITFGDLEASYDLTMNILYCPTTTSACINETSTDPTLLTVHSPWSGKVTRRIKHFSGYNVAVGRDGDMENRTSSTSTIGQSVVSLASSQINPPSTRALKAFFRIPDVDFLLDHVEFFRHFSGYMLASG